MDRSLQEQVIDAEAEDNFPGRFGLEGKSYTLFAPLVDFDKIQFFPHRFVTKNREQCSLPLRLLRALRVQEGCHTRPVLNLAPTKSNWWEEIRLICFKMKNNPLPQNVSIQVSMAGLYSCLMEAPN